MKTVSALLALALAFLAYFHLHRPISHPAGILIDSEPRQIAIDGEQIIEHGHIA